MFRTNHIRTSSESPFKVFVGIDFGTHGSGLAYALPNGKSYIHNLWDNEVPTTKPQTSVLLDRDSNVISVGSDALKLYLKAKKEREYQLFENFKMGLCEVEEKSMDDSEENDNLLTASRESTNGATESVFVAQLEYLKENAFRFIATHFEEKYALSGDMETGWNEVQYFLAVPGMFFTELAFLSLVSVHYLCAAMWSEHAKNQMIEWSVAAGLVSGDIDNQLQIVYEPDCAALSIHTARSFQGQRSKQKKGKRNRKYSSLIPQVRIDVPFKNGDKYILLDVGAGTCGVACHEVFDEFSITAVLPSSGSVSAFYGDQRVVHFQSDFVGHKWGSTNIDERFEGILKELFTDSITDIFNLSEYKQLYRELLDSFTKCKHSYYEQSTRQYHDIPLAENFLNFVLSQFQTENICTSGHMESQHALDGLNRKLAEYGTDASGQLNSDRKWLIKIVEEESEIVEISDDDEFGNDDEHERSRFLSLHTSVWRHMFDSIVNPIVAHVFNILAKQEMRDTKYIFLVGGFANAKYFETRMHQEFGQNPKFPNLSVKIPSLPELCVVNGAAHFGMLSNFIKSATEINQNSLSNSFSNLSMQSHGTYDSIGMFCAFSNPSRYFKDCCAAPKSAADDLKGNGRLEYSNIKKRQSGRKYMCTVGDQIGQGVFGAVHKGYHFETGQVVAVKKVFIGGSSVDERRQRKRRFDTEWRVMEQCNNQHIIGLIDTAFSGKNTGCIVMEYCKGGDLKQFINSKGPLHSNKAQYFAKQIKAGLLYMHSRKPPILHRDLKPANIMLSDKSSTPILKMTDFGVSQFKRAVNGKTKNKTYAGSDNYMAPEMLEKDGIDDHRSYGTNGMINMCVRKSAMLISLLSNLHDF